MMSWVSQHPCTSEILIWQKLWFVCCNVLFYKNKNCRMTSFEIGNKTKKEIKKTGLLVTLESSSIYFSMEVITSPCSSYQT